MTLDEDLVEAVEEISDADVDELEQRDDGSAHFLINSPVEEQDNDQIEEILNDAGYRLTKHIPAPEITQQFVEPIDEDDGGNDE